MLHAGGRPYVDQYLDAAAFEELQQEGVLLDGENEALRQDVRPMQVALLDS